MSYLYSRVVEEFLKIITVTQKKKQTQNYLVRKILKNTVKNRDQTVKNYKSYVCLQNHLSFYKTNVYHFCISTIILLYYLFIKEIVETSVRQTFPFQSPSPEDNLKPLIIICL